MSGCSGPVRPSYVECTSRAGPPYDDGMGDDEGEVRALYASLLRAWNERDAAAYGALFGEDGDLVGYDGSQMSGGAQITEAVGGIFADHETARYVSIVRGVRFPLPGVAVLRAEVGMVPPGGDDIVPERNAVQSMVAVGGSGQWRIALFQNTPAQFHGRPEATEALNAALRASLRA
jgi:uncharacterized protein (TIGR02246 family)